MKITIESREKGTRRRGIAMIVLPRSSYNHRTKPRRPNPDLENPPFFTTQIGNPRLYRIPRNGFLGKRVSEQERACGSVFHLYGPQIHAQTPVQTFREKDFFFSSFLSGKKQKNREATMRKGEKISNGYNNIKIKKIPKEKNRGDQ